METLAGKEGEEEEAAEEEKEKEKNGDMMICDDNISWGSTRLSVSRSIHQFAENCMPFSLGFYCWCCVNTLLLHLLFLRLARFLKAIMADF